ncbi:hypothetical protein V5O48_005059 [Marasmius crinis-equi]|uniref:VTT domain-containing protein n=1 Tax=Marasmius crinis-equi TaxID=585013 RepID=A0ABR3FNB3_9AGAR
MSLPPTSPAAPFASESTSTECSTLRAPLTLPSLGRRRSISALKLDPSCPLTPIFSPNTPPSPIRIPPVPLEQQQSSSGVMSSFSRLVQWFHFHPSHLVFINWQKSTSDRKHQGDDDLGLPLPASATKASFGNVLDEKHPSYPQQHWLLNWSMGFPSVHTPIFFVLTLLPVSTFLVYMALTSLPISMSWPHTITDIAQLGRELHGYSQSGPGPLAHVIGVMAVTAIWKHAWSIPGSVVWNVLAGALFSPAFATLLMTLLTTIGSMCATLLSAPLAPFLAHFFPKALEMTRVALEGDVAPATATTTSADLSLKHSSSSQKSGAWVRLSVLRLVGVVPWSGINIACGVCNVPLFDCFLGAFIGTLPWTAVTCQIGDILQTVASTPSPTPQTVSSLLLSPDVILKLIVLSFLSLAPILAKDRLKALISHQDEQQPNNSDTQELAISSPSEKDSRISRWTWAKGVKGWKVRLPSRSRTREERSREERLQQLESLVDEKRQIQARDSALAMLPS